MTVQISNPKINITQHNAERCLSAQQIERFRAIRPGDELLCARGVLWVTQEGDHEDHMIRKGEKYTVDRRGTVLVQALKEPACYKARD